MPSAVCARDGVPKFIKPGGHQDLFCVVRSFGIRRCDRVQGDPPQRSPDSGHCLLYRNHTCFHSSCRDLAKERFRRFVRDGKSRATQCDSEMGNRHGLHTPLDLLAATSQSLFRENVQRGRPMLDRRRLGWIADRLESRCLASCLAPFENAELGLLVLLLQGLFAGCSCGRRSSRRRRTSHLNNPHIRHWVSYIQNG